jgi:hypothetical protein
MNSGAEDLRAKLAEWRSWMNYRDPHSITHQLYQMMWDDLTFRIINECRRLARPAKEGGVELNGLVHTFIDRSYFRMQALAIRRLTEKNPRQASRGVISLRRLLDDIEAYATTFTRGNMFDAEGLPHDYSTERNAAVDDRLRRSTEAEAQGSAAFFLDARLEDAWHIPHGLHRDFDRMCGVDPTRRDRNDAVPRELLQALKKELEVCGDVEAYVDNRVAHAANPENRDAVPEGGRSVYLAKIHDCHKAICHVSSFVSVYLLRGPELAAVAGPQLDVFAFMDRPLARREDLTKLEAIWHEQECRGELWCVPKWPEGWEGGDE